MNRDEAEALGSERIAENRVDAGAHPAAAAGDLAQCQVARFSVGDVADGKLSPLLLLDGSQPEARSVLPQDAEHQRGFAFELLQRMGDEFLALLLGACEHSVADP